MKKLLLPIYTLVMVVALGILAHFTPIIWAATNNYLFLNGNVGIGTNSPGSSLDVNGQIRTSGNSGLLQLYNTSSTVSNINVGTGARLDISSGGLVDMSLASGGNVSITGNLNVTGSITSAGGSGAMTMISDQLLTNSTSTIVFSSIPQTYKDLRIEFSGRTDRASWADYVNLVFNNDTGANYDNQDFEAYFGGGSGSSGSNTTPVTSCGQAGLVTSANAPAGDSGDATITIPDYSSTTFHKNLHSEGGEAQNGDQVMWDDICSWRNTSAITNITLSPFYGPNFVAGTRATLYGLK